MYQSAGPRPGPGGRTSWPWRARAWWNPSSGRWLWGLSSASLCNSETTPLTKEGDRDRERKSKSKSKREAVTGSDGDELPPVSTNSPWLSTS